MSLLRLQIVALGRALFDRVVVTPRSSIGTFTIKQATELTACGDGVFFSLE